MLEGCIWGGGGGAEFKQSGRWRKYRIEESAHREVDHKDGMLKQCLVEEAQQLVGVSPMTYWKPVECAI